MWYPSMVMAAVCVCVCVHCRVIKVAKDYVGQVSFSVSSKKLMGAELQQFGLETEQEVCVGLFDSQGRKYAMTETFRYDIHPLSLCGGDTLCVSNIAPVHTQCR